MVYGFDCGVVFFDVEIQPRYVCMYVSRIPAMLIDNAPQ